MEPQKLIRFDDFVKGTRSRRESLVARGVLAVRRSGSEIKRNAEIGLFTKSSGFQALGVIHNIPNLFRLQLNRPGLPE
jgi:hypothetical protein